MFSFMEMPTMPCDAICSGPMESEWGQTSRRVAPPLVGLYRKTATSSELAYPNIKIRNGETASLSLFKGNILAPLKLAN